MDIRIFSEKATRAEVEEIAREFYGTMVKGVVDIERKVLALGGEYHMDANIVLLEHGSSQPNVWGFNIHLNREGDRLEYTSLINIRPAQGNRDMEVQDENLRKMMKEIIDQIVE